MKLSLKILSLLLVFVIASCGGDKDAESADSNGGGASSSDLEGKLAAVYNSMDNAMVVMTFDIETLKEKSDLINTLSKQMGPNPEIEMGIQQFDGILKKVHVIAAVDEFDPEMNSDPKGSAVVIAKIEDADKFNGLLGMVPIPDSEERDGFKIKDFGGQAKLAYNDDMIMLFADAQGDVSEMMDKALASSDTELNELLANSIGTSSDISIYGNMENFMGMYSKVIENMDIPSGDVSKYMDMYKGSSMVVDFNFENGKFVTTITNDIAQKGGSDLDVLADSGLPKDVLGKVANNPVAFGSVNMDFQSLVGMMKNFMKDEDINKANEGLATIGMTFDQVMELFDGKFAFAFNGMDVEQKMPKFGMYVGLEDPSKIENIITEKAGDNAVKDEAGIYTADKMHFYFGDKFMIANTDKEFLAGVVGGSAGDVSLGDQENILSSPINYYVGFDAITGNEELMKLIASNSPEAAKILGIFDKAYGNGSMAKFEYVLETKDKSSNILVQIIEAVSKAMSSTSNDFAYEAEEIEKEF
jgi:hypothetical protein